MLKNARWHSGGGTKIAINSPGLNKVAKLGESLRSKIILIKQYENVSKQFNITFETKVSTTRILCKNYLSRH